jgi:hypothetical protein
MGAPIRESVLVCPQCGHAAVESMPTDGSIHFYKCEACSAVLQPLAGDCCVFCSYGTVPCPSAQRVGTGSGG